jgi:hypothetical protein
MAAIDRLEKIPSRIVDANGVPVSGAKLDFYSAGTTSRKDTFSDAARMTANANPVVADSDGLLPSIFLAEGQYKIVAKTSADVTLWTRDDVQGGFDSAIGDALDAATASVFRVNIGARADINAAVDYGLATAADAAARTTAMATATAAAASERRSLYIPTSNAYTGSSAWTFNGPIPLYTETHVRGDSFMTTLLDFEDCGGFYMPNADAGNPTTESMLEHLHIRGSDNTGVSDNIGVHVRVARTFRMEHVTIERFTDCLVLDAAQFGGGNAGITFVRISELFVSQNHAANTANNYPRYGVRLYSSTGLNTIQDVEINGRIYSEISIAGPTTITSGTTLTRAGHGSPVRPLYRAAGIRMFRENAAGGAYTPLTQVASSPGTGEFSLVDQDTDAIGVGDDVRTTMANDITSVTATTGDTATPGRNIRGYWVDPKGLTGLVLKNCSAVRGAVAVGGYQTCIDVDAPAVQIDTRYLQICDVGVNFGSTAVDASVVLGEQSGSSVITKIAGAGATSSRNQYLRNMRAFDRTSIATAVFSTASLTPAAITMDTGNAYVTYLVTEHPGPREVRAELEVGVAGAAGSFGLFTLQVSYDGGTNYTTLAETRVNVDYRGRLVIEAQDPFMENTDAQVAPTFRYRVLVASSSTSTTVYAFGPPAATTLGANETTGATAITVAARDNYFIGQPLRVTLDDGTVHQSLIASGGNDIVHPRSAVTGAGDLTVATGIASDAASGNAVTGMVVGSWIGVRDVNPS